MGVDPNVILATSHGRRSIDVLKIYDVSKANWECKFLHLLNLKKGGGLRGSWGLMSGRSVVNGVEGRKAVANAFATLKILATLRV
jgi:hypothetical protein